MPRSAAGKAAREQKLSAASAWKRGHTGGRGRGKFRAQGRGGRGGRGGLGGRRDEWHGADARAAAASRDDGVHPETPTAPYEDDEDDDPVKAVRAGDAYQALLASLAGSGDDPADDEFADALAANDEASDSETASASDESRGDGDVEVSEGDGDEDRSSMEEEEDGDEPPDERGGDGDAKKASFRDDDEADAREGDEEDLVAETSSDEDDSPEDDSDDTNGTNDGSRRKRTGASETKDDCAKQKATDPLDAHLARRVDATVAERIKTLAPKFRPPSDVLSPTRITSAFTAKKTKATEKKEHTGSNESKEKETHVRAGRWEFDQAARGDARSELAEAPRDKKHRDEAAGRTFAVDAFASAFGDGSDKSTGFAPTDLPAKVKERWNATRDPEAHEARLKKQRRVLESVAAKAKKSGALDAKASVEAAKASAASELSSTPPAPYASRRQAEFHELLKTYADVTFPDRAPLGLTKSGAGDEMMDAYLLHAVAHVTRTRRRITKNNEALLRRAKAEEAARDAKKRAEREARSDREATATAAAAANADASASARTKSVAPKKNRVMVQDDVPRDQGFARATVLILVPMRNVAGKVVRRLLELCPAAHGRADAVSKLERLADDFGFDSDGEAAETEKRRKKNLWVPEDHSAMFSGNTDDHFRLGIKVTKASVRLYVDFFGSDILVASPLGLATKLKEGGPGAADFLASIELLVIDHADVIAMQNWQHLQTVLEALNKIPVKHADVDVMRVRESHLEGLALHHRQTVVLSSFASPEINALARNQCANVAGRARWRVLEYPGVLARAAADAGGARLRFDRVDDVKESGDSNADSKQKREKSETNSSVSRLDELRFKHFNRFTLPALRENPRPGSLVFVPSYFDFVRVRNLLTEHEVSFAVASEYTPPRDAARARTLFADGRKKVLLVTERAHFYHRRKVRGVTEVYFYALPERAEFFAEFCEFAAKADARDASSSAGLSANLATVAFSKLDGLRLERVVGTARAKKMLAPDANSAFVFTA